jgi:hypothetical protein
MVLFWESLSPDALVLGIGVIMEQIREKFTIEITGSGVCILSGEGKALQFTAGEALMLLDILRHEETNLRKIAEEASPIPIKIQV